MADKSFWEDWGLWAEVRVNKFFRAEDWQGLWRFAYDIISAVKDYATGFSWRDAFDPLRRLRLSLKDLRKKWDTQL